MKSGDHKQQAHMSHATNTRARPNVTHILHNHDQEWQFDAQHFVWFSRAGDIVSSDIGPHNLQHARLYILITDALDVPVAHFPVPKLQWFGAKR